MSRVLAITNIPAKGPNIYKITLSIYRPHRKGLTVEGAIFIKFDEDQMRFGTVMDGGSTVAVELFSVGERIEMLPLDPGALYSHVIREARTITT